MFMCLPFTEHSPSTCPVHGLAGAVGRTVTQTDTVIQLLGYNLRLLLGVSECSPASCTGHRSPSPCLRLPGHL